MMGRLRLSASETYDEIVQLGANTFGNEARTHSPAKPFDLATLKASLSEILIRRGFSENTMMIEDRVGEKRCRV